MMLLSLILIFGTSLYAVTEFKDKEEARETVSSLDNQVFGKNFPFERITLAQGMQWNDLLTQVELFVKKRDTALQPDFKKLLQASNDVLNALKLTFNVYIVPALKKPADKERGVRRLTDLTITKIKVADLEEQLSKLKKNRTDLISLRQKLRAPSTLKDKKKAQLSDEARDIVRQIAYILEDAIDKALNGLAKVKEAVKKA